MLMSAFCCSLFTLSLASFCSSRSKGPNRNSFARTYPDVYPSLFTFILNEVLAQTYSTKLILTIRLRCSRAEAGTRRPMSICVYMSTSAAATTCALMCLYVHSSGRDPWILFLVHSPLVFAVALSLATASSRKFAASIDVSRSALS